MTHSDDLTVDEYLRIVGDIIRHAAFADMLMMLLLAGIIDSRYDGLARAIYYTLDSFRSKRSLILRAAQATEKYEGEMRKQIDALIAGCERINKQRQRVAHNFFVGDEQAPDGIHEVHGRNLTQGSTRMTKKELHRRLFEARKGFKEATSASRAISEIRHERRRQAAPRRKEP